MGISISLLLILTMPTLQKLRLFHNDAGQIYSVNDARYFDCKLSKFLYLLLEVSSLCSCPLTSLAMSLLPSLCM